MPHLKFYFHRWQNFDHYDKYLIKRRVTNTHLLQIFHKNQSILSLIKKIKNSGCSIPLYRQSLRVRPEVNRNKRGTNSQRTSSQNRNHHGGHLTDSYRRRRQNDGTVCEDTKWFVSCRKYRLKVSTTLFCFLYFVYSHCEAILLLFM